MLLLFRLVYCYGFTSSVQLGITHVSGPDTRIGILLLRLGVVSKLKRASNVKVIDVLHLLLNHVILMECEF